MALTERERQQLESIEQRFSVQDPRLARLLYAPGLGVRMLWGPQRFWFTMLSLAAILALVGMSAWMGLDAVG